MNRSIIREAELKDVDLLTGIFWNNLLKQPAYISHGEIQMGVGADVGKVAENGKEMWRKYITDKIEERDSMVYMYVEEDGDAGEIFYGFVVGSIEEDGAHDFGVICDLLVLPENRKKGVGDVLMKNLMSWFDIRGIQDIYLESGEKNHAAHKFFENRGFEMVSHIYRLKH